MPPPPKRPLAHGSGVTPADARGIVAGLLKRYPGALVGAPEAVPTVPTGSLSLDLVLGGGYAVGRLTELYGAEGSGKTTIVQAAVAAAQRAGGYCAYVDVEQAVDPPYMQACGIDLERMDIWQPDSAEQALEIVLALVPVVPLIVVDSLAALAPRAELEGEMGDSHVGLLPRLLGQFTRKAAPLLRQHGTVLLLVNQLRMRVGVLYGNPETTPGGRAVPYAASTRLDVRREADLDLKEDGRITSVGARVTARKHKTGAPFGVAKIPIRLGHGVDRPREAYLLGRACGALAFTGNSARFEGELLGVGQGAVTARLREDPALTERLAAAILAAPQTERERAPAPVPEEEDTA